jgi:hypothetical protein
MRSLILVLLPLLTMQLANAQSFEVVEPSGFVSGTLEISQGRLLHFDRTGDRSYYSRDPSYDTPDGHFIGYYNFDRNRVLRFPRSGNGWMQTADLDDTVPRFRRTIAIVRPAGRLPGGGLAGPILGTPIIPGYGYGAPGYINPGFGRGYITPAPDYGPGYFIPPQPQSVLLDSNVIPNPPLPNAKVRLRNDGPREVQVAIVDLRQDSVLRSLRLPPGQASEVELERDNGAKRVANYRVITPFGDVVTQEIVTDIPPAVRYELVVHEWAMQSIAIDRTGKSPNPIEDVNFQGRGIGRFSLPPGPQLQSGTIDVYSTAKQRGNAGAVAPLVPDDQEPRDNASALERAILDAQRAAQRNR